MIADWMRADRTPPTVLAYDAVVAERDAAKRAVARVEAYLTSARFATTAGVLRAIGGSD